MQKKLDLFPLFCEQIEFFVGQLKKEAIISQTPLFFSDINCGLLFRQNIIKINLIIV